MCRAVLPPLATILGTGYTHTDAKLAALRDLSFLVVRPPGVSPEAVNLCLGNLVETILISPIILSMFSVRLVPFKSVHESLNCLNICG